MKATKMLIALAESEEARAEFDADPERFAIKHKLTTAETDVLKTGKKKKILKLLYKEVRNLLHETSKPLPKLWSNTEPTIDGISPRTAEAGELKVTLVGSYFPPAEDTEVHFTGNGDPISGSGIVVKGEGQAHSTLRCKAALEKGIYKVAIVVPKVGEAWSAPVPLRVS